MRRHTALILFILNRYYNLCNNFIFGNEVCISSGDQLIMENSSFRFRFRQGEWRVHDQTGISNFLPMITFVESLLHSMIWFFYDTISILRAKYVRNKVFWFPQLSVIMIFTSTDSSDETESVRVYKPKSPRRNISLPKFSRKEIKTIKTERKLKQSLDIPFPIFSRKVIKTIKTECQ